MSYAMPPRPHRPLERSPLARVIFEALESRVLLNAELGVPPPPDPELAGVEDALVADEGAVSLFAAIEAPTADGDVNGTAEDDEFDSSATSNELDGLAGDDRYVFEGAWGADTVADTGGGEDTLDFSAVTADLVFTIRLGAGNAVEVEVTDGTNTVTATGVEHLVGGEGDDEFRIVGDAALSGSIRGGDGDDTLVYENRAGGATVDFATGKATGVGGGDTALAVGGVELAITDDDDANPPSTPTTLSVTGTRGDDRFEAAEGTGTLTGGRGDDVYVFTDDSRTNAVRDGEDQGDDTLDLSAVTNGITFTAGTVDGEPGWTVTVDALTLTASGIDELAGGSGADQFTGGGTDTVYRFAEDWGSDTVTDDAGGDDTLDFSRVTADLTFSIGANGAVTVTDDAGNSVIAAGIEHLIGGRGNNEFVMQVGASLAGTIRGNSHARNTLDYGFFNDAVTVNLAERSATGIDDGVFGIQHVIGGAGDDVLTGDDADNELAGRDGDDSYDGGAGTDTVSFAGGDAVDADLVRGTALLAGIEETLAGIENLIGSSFGDVLTGDAADNVFVGGGGADTIDGGGGADTVDYRDAQQAVDVNLATGAVTGGATETLANIENVIGTGFGRGAGLGDSITGNGSANRIFIAAGADATVSGGNELVIDAGGNALAAATGTTVEIDGATVTHGGFESVRVRETLTAIDGDGVGQLAAGLRALAQRIANLEGSGAFALDLPLADAEGTSFGALLGFSRVLTKLADDFDEELQDANGDYEASDTAALREFFEDWAANELNNDDDLEGTREWIARTRGFMDSLVLDPSTGAVTELSLRHRSTNERTTFMDLSESALLTGAGVLFDHGQGFELTSGFDLDLTFGLDNWDAGAATGEFFVDTGERFDVRAFASLKDELPVQLTNLATRVGFLGGSLGSAAGIGSLSASANADFAAGDDRLSLVELELIGFAVANATGTLDSDLPFETGDGLEADVADDDLTFGAGNFLQAALDVAVPDELSSFTLATPGELLRMLGQLGGWLSSLSTSDILDLTIPFAGDTTLGDALDFGQAFGEEMLRYLVQHDGLRLGVETVKTGRLTDDAGDDAVATFTLALLADDAVEHRVTVALRAGATAFNSSAEDLRAQVEQALLDSAGDDDELRELVENVEVLLVEGRIAFRPLAQQTDVTRVTLPRIGNQVLGYDGRRLVVPRSLLAADESSPDYVGVLGHDLEFTLNVDGRSVTVAVERDRDADADNDSVADLITDIQTAVDAALAADALAGNLTEPRAITVERLAGADDRIVFTAGAGVQQVLLTAVRDPMVLIPDRLSLGLETATFPTAQQLANQLARVVNDAIGNDDVTVRFDVASRELTLSVSMDRSFDALELPFDLGVDLGGFVAIETAGALRLTADVGLDFTFGVNLLPQEELVVAPPVFQPELPDNGQLTDTAEFGFVLTQRNFAEDHRLSTGALNVGGFELDGASDPPVSWTAPESRLEDANGVLPDQHFFLRLSVPGESDRFVAGVLLAHDTLDNSSLDELADELAAAMTIALRTAAGDFSSASITASAAGEDSVALLLSGAPAGATVAHVTANEFRVATLTGIEVAPDAANTSVDDLVADVQAALDAALAAAGLGPKPDPLLGLDGAETLTAIPLVGAIEVPGDGVLHRDVRFSAVVGGETIRGIVRAADTSTNAGAADGGIAALARDVEAAINDALAGAARIDVRAYSPVGTETLSLHAGGGAVTAAAPAPHDGVLQDNVVFTLTVGGTAIDGTVRVQATADNAGADDAVDALAADVEAAINDALRNAGSAVRVTVGSDGDDRLTFAVTGGDLAIDFSDTPRRYLQYAASAGSPPFELTFESPQVIAQHTGGRISLTALPSLAQPDADSSPHVLDRRVGVTIEDFANTAYAELGLLSSPVPFDGRLDNDATFRIVVDGESHTITVAADVTNTSIDDLLADINQALVDEIGNDDVQVRRVALTDQAATENNRFEFFTSADSGIRRISLPALEQSSTNAAIAQLGFSTTDDSSARVQTAEFFIRDASLDGDVRLSAEGVTGTALVGFGGEGGLGVGVDFTGSGAVLGSVALDLVNPDFDAGNDPAADATRITLETLWNRLGRPGQLADLVDAAITGVVDIDLAAQPRLLGLGSAQLEPIAVSLDLDIADWLASAPTLDVPDAPTSIAVSVRGPDLSIYDALSSLSFSDIVDGLQQVLDFLVELQGVDGSLAAILDQPLPLLNQSPTELLVIADRFAALVDDVAANPARSLGVLEDTLENLLGLPEQFVTLSLDTANDSLALRVDLVFETSLDTSLGFDLDLADLVALTEPDSAARTLLDGLSNFVGVSSTGDLSVGVGGLVRLSLGIELGDGNGSAEALGFKLSDAAEEGDPPEARDVGTLEATGDAQAAADRLAEQDIVFELQVGTTEFITVTVSAGAQTRAPLVVDLATPLADLDRFDDPPDLGGAGDDLLVRLADGTVHRVDFGGAATVGDLVARLDAVSGLDAELDDEQRIVLTDTTTSSAASQTGVYVTLTGVVEGAALDFSLQVGHDEQAVSVFVAAAAPGTARRAWLASIEEAIRRALVDAGQINPVSAETVAVAYNGIVNGGQLTFQGTKDGFGERLTITRGGVFALESLGGADVATVLGLIPRGTERSTDSDGDGVLRGRSLRTDAPADTNGFVADLQAAIDAALAGENAPAVVVSLLAPAVPGSGMGRVQLTTAPGATIAVRSAGGGEIVPFLYNGENGTSIRLDARAAGDNLDFTAQVGPFGFYVVDGSAELAAFFAVLLVDTAETDGRTYFDDELDFATDYGGSATASLPLFFPDESTPVNDVDNVLTIGIPNIAAYMGLDAGGGELERETGSVTIAAPDLTAFPTPTLIGMLSNPEFLIDGLDSVLLSVQDALDGEILGVELPLIGDGLAPAGQFIADFRDDVLGYLSLKLRQGGLNPVTLVQETLYHIFAGEGDGDPAAVEVLGFDPGDSAVGVLEGGVLASGALARDAELNVTVGRDDAVRVVVRAEDVAGDTPQALVDALNDSLRGRGLDDDVVAAFVNVAGGFRLTLRAVNPAERIVVETAGAIPLDLFGLRVGALGLLNDVAGNASGAADGVVDIDDIVKSGFGLFDEFGQFDFLLGDRYVFNQPLDFDLGIPVLGFDLDAGVQLELGWEFAFGFGVSQEDGFYFVTDSTLGAGGSQELTVTAEVSLLGVLGYAPGAEGVADAAADRTVLTAVAELPSDGRLSRDLTFSLEVGGQTLDVTVTSTATNGNTTRAHLVADIEAAIDRALVARGLAPGLVTAGLHFDDAGRETGLLELAAAGAATSLSIVDRATARGQLGFLALDAVDGGRDGSGPYTSLGLTLAIDLRDPNADDDRLSFAEIASSSTSLGDMLVASADGRAIVNLGLTVSFDGFGLDTAMLPAIGTDLFVDWQLGFSTQTGVDIGTPEVHFNDITLDLGSFITDFAGPFLAELAAVLEPLDFLLDRDTGLLYQRLPVISDLAGETVTLLRLAELLDTSNRVVPFIRAVEQVYFLANLVTDAAQEARDAGGQILLDFGSISLPDLGSVDKLSDAEPGVPDGDPVGDFNRASSSSTPRTQTFTRTVTRPSNGGVSFDILDPSAIVDLLLGRPDVSLITYNLPTFGFDFEYLQRFPIYPPLFATLRGAFSATIDLGFGYDTLGLNQFRSSANPLDLVNGFFVNDLRDGVDIPEVTLDGTIAAGASLDVGVASAGVEGGINALIFFNLNDPNLDGRVRLGEMLGNVLINHFNPLAVFDTSGRFDAFLRAYVEVLFGLWSAEYEIARVTLATFEIPFNRTPILGSELGSGVLELNVGTAAKNRIHGSLGDGIDIISARYDAGSVYVRSGAVEQRFTGISKIVVNGGAGDDTINLTGLAGSGIEVEMHGGPGNDHLFGATGSKNRIFGDEGDDEITGGALDDELDGGAGDDVLTGGGGNDKLSGAAGNDRLLGGLGNDELDGGFGNDELRGELGDDVYVFGGSWGNDRVFDDTTTDAGGAGRDVWDFGRVTTDIAFNLGGDLQLAGIDGVELLPSGELRVTATRHGLRSGDHVELAGLELATAGGGSLLLRGSATVSVEDGELDTFIVHVPGVPAGAVPVAGTGVFRLDRAALTVEELRSADEADPAAAIQIETAVRHGLASGDVVRLGGIDPVTGRAVVDATEYVVTVVDARRFNLDGTTFAGSALALAGAFVQVDVEGSGFVETITKGAGVTIASVGHGLAAGDEIALFGLTGAAAAANGHYVVASVAADGSSFTLDLGARDGARLAALANGALDGGSGVWQLSRTHAASLGNTVTHNGYGIEELRSGRGGDRFDTYQTGAAEILLDGRGGSDTYVAHTLNARVGAGATSSVRLLDRGDFWDTDKVVYLGSQGGDALAVDQTSVVSLLSGTAGDPRFTYGEANVVLGFDSGASGQGMLTAGTPLTTGQLERAARMLVTLGTDDPVLVVVEPGDVGGAGTAADLVAALNAALGATPLAGRLAASAVTAGGAFTVVLTAADANTVIAVDNVSEGSGIEAFRIDAAGGNDAVAIANTNARTSVQVAAGRGDDVITIGGPADLNATAVTLQGIRGTALTGPIFVDGQEGDDRLLVTDAGNTSGVEGTLTDRRLAGLGMQVAIDYRGVENLGLQLGQGADELVIERTIAGSTDVAAGAGADTVTVQDVNGVLLVLGEQGADALTLQASSAGSRTRLSGGGGDDAVQIRTMAGDVEVSGGTQDDTIDVGTSAGVPAAAAAAASGPGEAKTALAAAVPGDVNLIKGLLSISGGTGLDTLNIDDSADGGSTLLAALPIASEVAAAGRLRGDAHFDVSLDGGAAVAVTVIAERGVLAAANAVPASIAASGRLSADAKLVLLLGGDEIELTVQRAAGNDSIGDLLDDLNEALDFAGLDAARVSAEYDAATGRFAFVSKQGETLEIRVSDGNTAATELGFADGTHAEFDNHSLENLAADVNAALTQAGVGGRVAASIEQGRLALTLADGTLRVNVAADDPAARDLGLVDGQLLQPHNTATLVVNQATGRAELTGLGMGPLGDGTPGIVYDTIAQVNIALGSGNDTFYVRGTLNDEAPLPSHTTIATGGGDDAIVVSDAAAGALDGTLDAVAGELTILAGAGNNALAISDRASTAADGGVLITAQRVEGLAPAAINYSTTGRFAGGIEIWAGSSHDTIRVASVLAGHVTSLFANSGDDFITIADQDAAVADGLLLVYGQGNRDTLDASGWNEDLIMFGDFGEVAFAGSDRTVDGVVLAATANALAGDFDVLLGGAGHDLLFGGAGGDTLAGGAGHDVLHGDAGRVVLLNGVLVSVEVTAPFDGALPADDELHGEGGNDFLLGSLGADTLLGGLGDDVAIGDAGRLTFVGGVLVQAESIELFRGAGDRVAGGFMTEASRLGGDGHDVLIGGAGFDLMFGTLAEDIMVFEHGRVTFADGRAQSVVTLGQQPLDLAASQMFGLYLKAPPGLAPYVPAPHAASAPPAAEPSITVSTGNRARIPMHHQRVAQTIDLPGVEFELGSANLAGDTQALLEQIGMLLADFPGAVIEVGGHTDATGSTELNQALSQLRAEAVRAALIAQGVDAARLRAVGYGESRPVADNDTDEGRARNRRVELAISGDGSDDDAPDAAVGLDDAVIGVLSVQGWRSAQRAATAERAPRRRIDW